MKLNFGAENADDDGEVRKVKSGERWTGKV
jgi:hypothetical protein